MGPPFLADRGLSCIAGRVFLSWAQITIIGIIGRLSTRDCRESVPFGLAKRDYRINWPIGRPLGLEGTPKRTIAQVGRCLGSFIRPPGGFVRAAHKEGWFEVIAGKGVVASRREEPDEESFRGFIPIS